METSDSSFLYLQYVDSCLSLEYMLVRLTRHPGILHCNLGVFFLGVSFLGVCPLTGDDEPVSLVGVTTLPYCLSGLGLCCLFLVGDGILITSGSGNINWLVLKLFSISNVSECFDSSHSVCR